MEFIIVLAVGFLVGTINGLAGGASAISFPVLLAFGLNPITAAITNSLGVSTANLFALISERRVLKQYAREYKNLIIWASVGAVIGATILLGFPEKVFAEIVPFLLLFATISMLIPLRPSDERRSPRKESAMIFGSGIYGGYFGPGQGTMVIATLIRKRDVRTVNIAKNLIIGTTSIFTTSIYLFSGHVHWLYFWALFIGSNIGGFFAGKIAGHVSVRFLKSLVVAVGLSASVWLFIR